MMAGLLCSNDKRRPRTMSKVVSNEEAEREALAPLCLVAKAESLIVETNT